jgi:hypothetical protein
MISTVVERARRGFFTRDYSNVDMALTQNAQAKTRLFRSGSIYLISFNILVAGTGFEPVTFRL